MTTSPVSHRRCNRSPRRGFSLIELLCAIGIIAILIALLMPAINQAKRQARMTTCASQLHQIHMASQSWKVDNERQGNPIPMQATGWRTEYARFVKDKRIYNCPEDMLAVEFKDENNIATGDTAGTAATPGGTNSSGGTGSSGGGSAGGGSTGSGGSTGTSGSQGTAGDIADAIIRISPNGAGGPTYDIALKDGPWFKTTENSDGSKEMWLEDQFFAGGGDRDFKDIGVKVSKNSDGTMQITLLGLQKGVPAYRSDVLTKGPDGTPKTLFENCYKGGANGGATAKLSDNTNAFGGGGTGGTGGSNGTGGGTDGTANGGTGGSDSTTGGTGVTGGTGTHDSSYGLNAYVKFIDGDADKIFGMDYNHSVIDPTKDDFASFPVNPKTKGPQFARHGSYANVLYGDGSVRAAIPTKTSINPAFGDNRLRLWQK